MYEVYLSLKITHITAIITQILHKKFEQIFKKKSTLKNYALLK